MGLDLGAIGASVTLNTAPLAAGVVKAKGMFSGLDKSLSGGLPKAEKGLAGIGNSLKNLAGFGGTATNSLGALGGQLGTLGSIGLVAGAVVGLGAGLYSCAKAAEEDAKILAQTNAVIKSTGGVAGVTAKDVEKLGEDLADVSGVSHDVIKSAENIMLTFRKVANVGQDRIFDEAIASTLDMSVAMKKDLSDSAIKVGKALQDPVKGLTALRRYGVTFTDSQVAMAKSMVESNNLMGAQKMILAELKTEFGGSAEALGGTLTGQIGKLKDQWDRFMETVGKNVLPSVTSTIEGFASALKGLEAIKVPEILGFLAKLNFGGIKSGLESVMGYLWGTSSVDLEKTFNLTDYQKRVIKQLEDAGGTLHVPVEVKPKESDLDRLKHLSGEIPTVYILPDVDMTQVTAAKTAAHQGWNTPSIILAPFVDMSQVTAAKTRAHQGWNEPPIILAPLVDMSQVDAAKVRAHQGWTPPPVTVPTTSAPSGRGIAGGAVAGASAMSDLASATALANRSFGNFIKDMNAEPLNEVNDAIMRMTANNTSSLADWWKLRGFYDAATKSLANYEKQIKTGEAAITSLEGKIEKANAARERPSMVMDKASSELQLKIMKAEDVHNYALAAKLTLEKDALDRKKEELDLTTSIADKTKELKDTSAFAGKTTAQIDAMIAAWSAALLKKTSQVAALRVTYDKVQTSVDKFKKIIDDLSAHFTSKSPAPAGYAGGSSYVPKTGMAMVHRGEQIIPANLNPLTLGGGGTIVVNSYTTLDGKVLTKTVSRHQGALASSRSSSGGRY